MSIAAHRGRPIGSKSVQDTEEEYKNHRVEARISLALEIAMRDKWVKEKSHRQRPDEECIKKEKAGGGWNVVKVTWAEGLNKRNARIRELSSQVSRGYV